MNQEALATASVRAEGDTLFNGISTVTLWNVLVAAGVLPKQKALVALDAALLVMEQRRESWSADVGIIDQARTRLEALIGQIKIAPVEIPPD